MKKNLLMVILVGIFVFCGMNPVIADSVVLRDGKVVVGAIVGKTSMYVNMDVLGAPMDVYYLAEDVDSINGVPFRRYRMAQNKLLTQKVSRQKNQKYPVVTLTLKNGSQVTGELVLRHPQFFRILSADGSCREILVEDIASLH